MIQGSKARKKYISRADSLKRVEDELRLRVATSVWAPGVMLPSRRALATEFGVDLHTVQRAIVPLMEDGLLRADGGRGTFVADHLPDGAAFTFAAAPSSGIGSYSGRTDLSRQVTPQVDLGTLGIIAAYDGSRDMLGNITGVGSQESLRSLERAFGEAGGKTIVYNLLKEDGSWETVPQATEELVKLGVSALAVIGIDRDPILRDVKLPEWFGKTIPVVHISSEGDFQSPIHVYFDNRQAGLQAADHLLTIGCRRFVFIVPFTVPWLDDRVEGARLALKRAGLDPELLEIYPPSHPLVLFSDEAAAATEQAINAAFGENLFVDGVIAPNDAVAHQVIRLAQKYGKVVGKDFALIGFDDIPASSFVGLTSLRPPFEEMGKEASSLLIRLLNGDRVNMHLCLPSHITIRSSTHSYKL